MQAAHLKRTWPGTEPKRAECMTPCRRLTKGQGAGAGANAGAGAGAEGRAREAHLVLLAHERAGMHDVGVDGLQ